MKDLESKEPDAIQSDNHVKNDVIIDGLNIIYESLNLHVYADVSETTNIFAVN